jgi:hypothetical protein
MMQAGPTHSGGNAAAEARGWPDFRAGGGRPSDLAVALPAARMSKALPNAETKFVVEPVYIQTTSPQVGRMFSKYVYFLYFYRFGRRPVYSLQRASSGFL